MRQMNENATTKDIKTVLCIKLLRVYLVYIMEKHKWKEAWQYIAANIGNR